MADVQIKPYMRDGKLVRGYRRLGRQIAEQVGQGVQRQAGSGMVNAEKAVFLKALSQRLQKAGLKPADLLNDKMAGASGASDRAHAVLLQALRDTGYKVQVAEDGSGVATSKDGARKVSINSPSNWDNVTYWTPDGRPRDNRTDKARSFGK